MQQNIVIFDGSCGICNALRLKVENWDKQNIIKFIAYQSPEFPALTQLITKKEASESLYLITSDNEISKGAQAIFQMLTFLSPQWRVLGRIGSIKIIHMIMQPFYEIIARNRSIISEKMGMTACPYPRL